MISFKRSCVGKGCVAEGRRCPLLQPEERFSWDGSCWQPCSGAAALCTTGKVSLLNTLAQIKDSQGQQSRRRA